MCFQQATLQVCPFLDSSVMEWNLHHAKQAVLGDDKSQSQLNLRRHSVASAHSSFFLPLFPRRAADPEGSQGGEFPRVQREIH